MTEPTKPTPPTSSSTGGKSSVPPAAKAAPPAAAAPPLSPGAAAPPLPPAAAAAPKPVPAAAAVPERARIEAPPGRFTDNLPLPLLYGAGAVVLVGAVLYLLFNPQGTREADLLRPQLETLTARITALEGRQIPSVAPVEGRVAALEGRLAQVETRPAPQPPDLSPLTARVDAAATKADVQALATRVDALAPRADLQALSQRLDATTAAATTATQALTTRLDAAAGKTDLAALSSRLDASETRATALATQARTAATEAATQSAAQLKSQVDSQLAAITQTAQRLQRVQAAAVALDAGQRLGELPGAPPALARFTGEAPPTEASLRLSFDAAAEAARAATAPAASSGEPLGSRMWARAQQSLTVRQGDQIVVGNPVNSVLTRAKQSLDAGDLPGALSVLSGLPAPAAEAMKPWTGRAQALLDARSALAAMARG